MSSMNKRQFGFTKEKLVCNYLQKHGYNVIQTNCYMGKLGEIDIVAKSDDGCLVFVEVRSHTTNRIHPSQILGQGKIKRLRLLTRLWLKKNKLPEFETDWRIDLIVISGSRKITWYKSIC